MTTRAWLRLVAAVVATSVIVFGAFVLASGRRPAQMWTEQQQATALHTADSAAAGLGTVQLRFVGQTQQLTSPGAYAVARITLARTAPPPDVLRRFTANLATLGLPAVSQPDCIQPHGDDITVCTGDYGDITITGTEIVWSAAQEVWLRPASV